MKNSVKSKLLFVIIPILTIALIAVALINHNKAKGFLEDNFEEKSMVQLELLKTKLNERLTSHAERLKNIASSSEIRSMNKDIQMKYMEKMIKEYPQYDMFFITDTKGNSFTTENKEANISDRPYFQEIMSGKPYVISNPITSKTSGKVSIIFATPILDHNKKVNGMFATSFPLDNLHKIVEEVKIGQTGYAFVTQSDGLIISHADKSLVQKLNITEMGEPKLEKAHAEVQKGQKGMVRYTFKGVEKYNFYSQLPITGWDLYLTAPVKEASSQLSYLAKLSFVTAAIVLIAAIIIIVIFSTRLVRPIQKMSELTSHVAAGDLTIKVEHSAKDEIGVLGNNFNAMIGKMQALLKQIGIVSHQVKDSSGQMVQKSEETKISAEQVASSIEELATGTSDIVSSVSNVSNKVNEMNSTLSQITYFVEDVSKTSKQSNESAEKGQVYVNEAIAKISEANQTVMETAAIIRKVDQQSAEIGDVIAIITGIADQTNLLALNASIEAARAGDGGKGFAVVAEEVRKLANETAKSAEQIASLISQTQAQSHQAVESIDTGSKVVQDGMQAVLKSGEAFKEIASNVNKVSQENDNIVKSIRNLEDISIGIGSDMENISAVTEQSSAGAEEVSAASQQQAAGAYQMASDAENLSKLSEDLKQLMDQFKI